MLGFKFGVVAAALVSAVVATEVHGPHEHVCETAPAVTTTVTVTECGGQPGPTTSAVAPIPPVEPTKSEGYGTVSPPVETSILHTEPAPSEPATSVLVPGPSGPSGPVHSPSGGPKPSAPPASSGAAPSDPSSPSGTDSPSGTEPSSPSSTAAPSSPHSQSSDNPPAASSSVEPPSNAAPLPTAFSGMGSLIAAGVAINAAIAVLV